MSSRGTNGNLLPMLDKNVNNSPHVVLLGAGASVASFPNGDRNAKKLPVVDDFVETLGLSKTLDKEGIPHKDSNIEEIYAALIGDKKYESQVERIEGIIHKYFSEMVIPEEPTLYDYLILSLREKDLIATFNWDPLLLQAYRRHVHIRKLPKLAFLHGNVALGVCRRDRVLGHIDTVCNKCKRPLSPARLLYPIKQKNYSSDPLIGDQWQLLRNKLKIAYFLTIFGYSAPLSDVDAINLMLRIWKDNLSLELAQIDIIDKKPKDELKNTWSKFIVRQHFGICNDFFDSYQARYPRRSCDALAAATLMLNPWKRNKFPKFETIAELHKWIEPLLEDEIRYEKFNEPFKYMVN